MYSVEERSIPIKLHAFTHEVPTRWILIYQLKIANVIDVQLVLSIIVRSVSNEIDVKDSFDCSLVVTKKNKIKRIFFNFY